MTNLKEWHQTGIVRSQLHTYKRRVKKMRPVQYYTRTIKINSP